MQAGGIGLPVTVRPELDLELAHALGHMPRRDAGHFVRRDMQVME
jgi:hypothetical protein